MTETSKNDITGDSIITRGSSQAYRDNYDSIFRKPKYKIQCAGGCKTMVEVKQEDEGCDHLCKECSNEVD